MSNINQQESPKQKTIREAYGDQWEKVSEKS